MLLLKRRVFGVLMAAATLLAVGTASRADEAAKVVPAAFWTGWSQVPGGGATPDAPGATTYQGRLYVFVRGTDNKIYLNRLTGSSAWTGWSEVPGGGFTPSGPAATSY